MNPRKSSDRNEIETDALAMQADHLRGDFLARAATLILITLAAFSSPVLWQQIAVLFAFMLTEVSQYLIGRGFSGSGDRRWRIAFVLNTFLAASIFSLYPLVLWRTGLPAFQFMALSLMTAAIVHCVLVRSHHLKLCLMTLTPLASCTTVMFEVVPENRTTS